MSTTTSPSGRSEHAALDGAGADPATPPQSGPGRVELDADHQAALADFAHRGTRRDPFGEEVRQLLGAGADVGEDVPGLEEAQVFERDRGGEGVPAVGVPVVEGLGPEVGAEERVEDAARRHGGAHGEVPARDPLAQTEEVGAEPACSDANERAGAAEARRHLVADQEGAGACARLTEAAQIRGGGHQDARRTLDERLDHDGGQLVGVGVDHGARLVRPAGVGVAGGAQHREAQRLEDRTEHAAVTEGERADGVAVVGVAEGEEAGTPRAASRAARCRGRCGAGRG